MRTSWRASKREEKLQFTIGYNTLEGIDETCQEIFDEVEGCEAKAQ